LISVDKFCFPPPARPTDCRAIRRALVTTA
jgi:hypothetical protein